MDRSAVGTLPSLCALFQGLALPGGNATSPDAAGAAELAAAGDEAAFGVAAGGAVSAGAPGLALGVVPGGVVEWPQPVAIDHGMHTATADIPMRIRARDMRQGYDGWAARVELEAKRRFVGRAGDDEASALR